MVHNEALQSTASTARTRANERLMHEAVGGHARLGVRSIFSCGREENSFSPAPFSDLQGLTEISLRIRASWAQIPCLMAGSMLN